MSAIEVASPRGRRLAVVTAITGTVFIAAGAFWLSFTALADLARRSGIDAGQAWAWPLIVDGIIVVATVAVVALASQRRPTWYPWTLLAAGAVVSVTANAIHANVSPHDPPRSVLASATPTYTARESSAQSASTAIPAMTSNNFMCPRRLRPSPATVNRRLEPK